MVVKHKIRKKKNCKNYGKSNKEFNALIEKKFQKFVNNRKRRKREKELQHLQDIQISNNDSEKMSQALPRA